jgi:hypothetical protein
MLLRGRTIITRPWPENRSQVQSHLFVEDEQKKSLSEHSPNSGIHFLHRALRSPKALDFTARLRSLQLFQQDKQRTHKRNILAYSRNYCWSGQALSIIYSECVCSLKLYSTQCACAVLYCHLLPVRLCNIFPHSVINGTILGKKLFDIKCVLIFSTTFLWNISYSKNNSARYHARK